jgi:hypothetical protein
MLTPAHLVKLPPVTIELSDLLGRLKADLFVVGWLDPVRGLQVMPIGKGAVGPGTMIHHVPGEFEVAVLLAAKQLLDEGNEDAAYSCLTEMVDEKPT